MTGLRNSKRSKEAIETDIRAEIAASLRLLSMDSCHAELSMFDAADGVCVIRFSGSCTDCDASAATFIHGIEARLRLRIPELRAMRIEETR